MEEVFFYNWERKPIMQWINFKLRSDKGTKVVSFEVKVTKSIFEATVIVETELEDLIKLKKDLIKLYELNIRNFLFVSSDSRLIIDLRRDESGRIYQKFLINEPKTNNNLTVKDYFDQTFLPDLNESLNKILM